MTTNQIADTKINGSSALDELPKEAKLKVLQGKREMYLEAQYDCIIECQAAKLFKNEAAEKAQMERMKEILKMLDFLKEKMAELE